MFYYQSMILWSIVALGNCSCLAKRKLLFYSEWNSKADSWISSLTVKQVCKVIELNQCPIYYASTCWQDRLSVPSKLICSTIPRVPKKQDMLQWFDGYDVWETHSVSLQLQCCEVRHVRVCSVAVNQWFDIEQLFLKLLQTRKKLGKKYCL